MSAISTLKTEVLKELTDNILPFWAGRMADPRGGFFGRMDGSGALHPEAEKGAILNARILWTFSSAYRLLGRREYLETARTAYAFIRDRFIDRQFGGAFWSLNADGSPRGTKKQIYAIAFIIYALAEYSRACGDADALTLAKGLFRDIETHSLDPVQGGYLEAFTRQWDAISDMRLSERDRNDAKTMNTHLHILEAYTALYRIWKDESLSKALGGIIGIFLDRIILDNGHLGLFFGTSWSLHSTTVSYGHEIEASWLLWEAAQVLGDSALEDRASAASAILAASAMEGFSEKGGMIYEHCPETGQTNTSRDWWVQAETVLGCLKCHRMTGDGVWLERALAQWDFIREHIICPDGEWYWSALPDGRGGFSPNTADDRAGFWKCPYHNGRMCLEIIDI